MRVLKKLSINELKEDGNVILPKEKMSAIRGGGGGCYSYCDGVLTIRQSCDWDGCPPPRHLACYYCY
ncbi:MAG: hypothetical protein LUH63_09510 [Parabacteroides sp.]|nr:hypothetical protein [Parabacteroides sp.]